MHLSPIDIMQRARAHWNAGDLPGYLNLYHRDAVLHGYQGVEPGIQGITAFYNQFLQAFAGSQLTFQDLFAVEDRVACRFELRGTHNGPFNGMPATGRQIVIPGITLLRFQGDRCVERWSQADFLGLLQQLGALPA